MKFFPSDWRADPALRMCSLAARGLWIEMLTIMHEADPRGHLVINGKSVSPRHLGSLVGSTETEVTALLSELRAAGVFSTRRNGVVFSRRMERDEQKSRKARDNGKKGGNPTLCKNTKNRQSLNPQDKTQKPEARSQRPDIEADASILPLTPKGEGDEKAALDRWNLMAAQHGLPQAKMNSKREQRLKARLSEVGGLDGWDAALAKVAASSFCLGRKTDFRATLDFVLQAASFTKLIEGNYDDSRKSGGARSRVDELDAAFEERLGKPRGHGRFAAQFELRRTQHAGHQPEEDPGLPDQALGEEFTYRKGQDGSYGGT